MSCARAPSLSAQTHSVLPKNLQWGWVGGSGTGQQREVLEDLVALESVRDHRHAALHVPLEHDLHPNDNG